MAWYCLLGFILFLGSFCFSILLLLVLQVLTFPSWPCRTTAMDNSCNSCNGNGHSIIRLPPYQACLKMSLPWLDVRVCYIRISECDFDDSTPEYLTLNYIPLKPDTLLEVNGVSNNYNSDGVSVLLRRDRMDRNSEEVTFVTTDSIRMTGAVKLQVFDKDVLILSGIIDSSDSNGHMGESNDSERKWSMHCETDIHAGCFIKAKKLMNPNSTSPVIEAYIAGSFLSNPIILTKTLQLGSEKKYVSTWMLDAMLENEANEYQNDVPPSLALQAPTYLDHKPEDEGCTRFNPAMAYIEGEDVELSWFTAGVRVGVGIGLSVCVGLGIGVGLLVQTYQGTARNFRRRIL